ncbi:VirB8/TrbF family protein [Rickettsiaceae bacterium]|nr:VirB8/TrbF family protein [Rickettsiaceae bacterium]
MESLQSYITSGDYFVDARKWYHEKYTHPLSHRSFVFIFSTIICILFLGLAISTYSLLPLNTQMKLVINTTSSEGQNISVARASYMKGAAINSVADIMIRNYIEARESYNYNNLKDQFTFVQNNSSRIVFRKFYSFMSIDNPSSPIMIYQKSITNKVNIISIKYSGINQATIKLRSKAQRFSGELVDNNLWEILISYEIDPINPSLPTDSKFGFIVTDYQSKLLKSNASK